MTLAELNKKAANGTITPEDIAAYNAENVSVACKYNAGGTIYVRVTVGDSPSGFNLNELTARQMGSVGAAVQRWALSQTAETKAAGMAADALKKAEAAAAEAAKIEKAREMAKASRSA